ncbi:NAD-dependent aldehyde dehydrogenase [Mycobacteroides abscessus subsp. bolletii]|nr:NAD-dependent aldehyde dehydrogenase [Mycobacteroides abscessus subsp. bolletii]
MTTVSSDRDGTMEANDGQTSLALIERAATRGERRMLIDGDLCGSSTGAEFDNVNPATGKTFRSTAAASADDMDRAISAARRAFDAGTWRADKALRKRCLLQLQDALEREREDLREEIVAEVGAPIMTTHIAQLDWPLSDALTYPASLIDNFSWERDLGPGTAGESDNQRRVFKEPMGVIGAIAPWNFPFEIVANKLGQALATGNTVVLKPDPNTPWTSTRIGRLVAEHTDIPDGVVNIVTTPDNAVAERLVTDPRVDQVSFTGSTDTGRLIARMGADSLKRVFLELGGKSALVILDDADLDSLLPNTLQVCMHAGQGCAINTRVLVHRDRYDEFVEKVSELFGMIAPGDPADPGTLLGPVINARQRDRILGFIDRARAAGGQITVGGTVPQDLDPALSGGTYVLPTVVAGLDNSAEIAQREVFGPVLTVLAYRDEADALSVANDSCYGLSGSVYSGSTERGMKFAAQLRAGSVIVNGGMFYGADAPYGGYKSSGIGRQNGLEGFEQYLETKTVGYR